MNLMKYGCSWIGSYLSTWSQKNMSGTHLLHSWRLWGNYRFPKFLIQSRTYTVFIGSKVTKSPRNISVKNDDNELQGTSSVVTSSINISFHYITVFKRVKFFYNVLFLLLIKNMPPKEKKWYLNEYLLCNQRECHTLIILCSAVVDYSILALMSKNSWI